MNYDELHKYIINIPINKVVINTQYGFITCMIDDNGIIIKDSGTKDA